MWYARVLLLFKIQVRTDDDMLANPQAGLTVTELELAFLDVMSSAKLPADQNRHNRILIYAPQPLPRVYVIPCNDILGKLPVIWAGDSGTINASMPMSWFDSDAKRDTAGQTNGSTLLGYGT